MEAEKKRKSEGCDSKRLRRGAEGAVGDWVDRF
jgi:hypothetical protein